MLNTFFNLVVCLIEDMFYRGIHMLILSIYEVSHNITHTSTLIFILFSFVLFAFMQKALQEMAGFHNHSKAGVRRIIFLCNFNTVILAL